MLKSDTLQGTPRALVSRLEQPPPAVPGISMQGLFVAFGTPDITLMMTVRRLRVKVRGKPARFRLHD